MPPPLDELRSCIARLNWCDPARSSLAVHKDIYSLIEDTFAHNPAYTPYSPPLDIIIYAISFILSLPTLHDIPDLLNLLVFAESYRQLASSKAREAIQYHASHPYLTPAEEKKVAKLAQAESNHHHREIYVLLVLDLCKLDIYQLWTSPDSHLLPARLNAYFPTLNPENNNTPPHLFHFDFSEDEKADLHATANACLEFLHQANTWEIKRENHFKERGIHALLHEENEFVSYKRDFAATFKCNVDTPALISNIQFYTRKVQSYVHILQPIFHSA